MDFLIRVWNGRDLTFEYYSEIDYHIKPIDVLADPNNKYYLIRTYNTIIDLLNVQLGQ